MSFNVRPAVRICALYSLFASLAILVNLLVQEAVLKNFHTRTAILLAMASGTLAGLILKYILDKAWIFRHKHRNAAHNIQMFVVYSTFGLATTAIFWGTEYAATLVSSRALTRNIGAVIGLIIGYYIKYQLDKKFTFTNSTTEASEASSFFQSH